MPKHTMFNDAEIDRVRQMFEVKARELVKLPRAAREGLELVPRLIIEKAWQDKYTFTRFTAFGMAKLFDDNADDLPPVGFGLEEDSIKIRHFGNKYGYTEPQLKAWFENGERLDSTLAEEAKDEIDFKIDSVILKGLPELGSQGNVGLLNNPNVPMVVLPTGASGKTALKEKTFDEVVKTIRAMVSQYEKNNADKNGLARIKGGLTLLLPRDAYDTLTDKLMANSEKSWLSRIKELFEGDIAEIRKCSACNGAGAGGADRALLYKKEPRYIGAVVPVLFYQGKPQNNNFKWSVPCMGRAAGVVFKYVKAALYADGI